MLFNFDYILHVALSGTDSHFCLLAGNDNIKIARNRGHPEAEVQISFMTFVFLGTQALCKSPWCVGREPDCRRSTVGILVMRQSVAVGSEVLLEYRSLP